MTDGHIIDKLSSAHWPLLFFVITSVQFTCALDNALAAGTPCVKVEDTAAAQEADLQQHQEGRQGTALIQSRLRELNIDSRVDAIASPGHRVTGDFMRVEKLRYGRVAIFLGDVVSHGPIAAAESVRLHRDLDRLNLPTSIGASSTAADVLSSIDRTVNFSKMHQMLTLSVAVYDPRTRELQFASGGVPPLFVRRANGTVEAVEAAGFYIGFDKDGYAADNPKTITVTLGRGDIVVMASDGARDFLPVGQDRNKDRLEEFLKAHPGLSLTEIPPRVLSSLVDGKDDATILALDFSRVSP